jgi:hypothetical protein
VVGPWRFAEYLFLLDLTSSTAFFPTPLVSPIEYCSRDPQPPCVVEDNFLARARLELSLGSYIECLEQGQRAPQMVYVQPLYIVVAGLRAPTHFLPASTLPKRPALGVGWM